MGDVTGNTKRRDVLRGFVAHFSKKENDEGATRSALNYVVIFSIAFVLFTAMRRGSLPRIGKCRDRFVEDLLNSFFIFLKIPMLFLTNSFIYSAPKFAILNTTTKKF